MVFLYPGPVKGGDHFGGGGIRFLPEAVEVAHGHIVDERAVRLTVDAPGELRKVLKPRHGRVLAHKREEYTAARELIGGKVNDVHRVLAPAGEDEVPYKDTGAEHTAFIQNV